jgi:uncharacterized protein YqjF (DUF2071 family)
MYPGLPFLRADVGSAGTDLIFSATENQAAKSRIANVSFVSQQFPELNVKLVVTQEGKSEGTLSV